MSALLELEGVTVDAGSVPIVRDATLSVDEGESLGVVGESGSGKSMTARAVLRLLPARLRAGGAVRFDGHDVLGMGRAELKHLRSHDVAMIPQDPRAHVNPVRTIGDFLVEGLRHRGVARGEAQERMVTLLDEIGVNDARRRMGQHPHELSGGQLQRVAIAAALAVEPRLIVADEPTTALDVTTQADVIATLTELRAERRLALLFITHDLELAAATCDRIVVMYAGTTVESLPAAELDRAPAHPYTAALLRSRPRVDRDAHRLTVIPGRPISAAEAPAGCPFEPRCPLSTERCTREMPQRRVVRASIVACHHAEQTAAAA